ATAEKITVFNAKKLATHLQRTVAEQNAVLQQYGIADAVERQRRLAEQEALLATCAEELAALERSKTELRGELVALESAVEHQNMLYDYQHPAETSAELADELSRLRAQIKSM